MSYQSPLRDLIVQIDAVAQRHIAYPQACDALRHLRDHLSALARCEEINRVGSANDAAAADLNASRVKQAGPLPWEQSPPFRR